MERSGVKCFHYTHVFDLTNLGGEKRRNVGKLNNELNIVNQLVDLHFLLFVNITGNWKNRLAHTLLERSWRVLSQGEFKPSSSDSADRGRSIIRVTSDTTFLLLLTGYFDVVLKTKSIMDKLWYLLKLGIEIFKQHKVKCI